LRISAVNGFIKEIGLFFMLSKRLTIRAAALFLLAAGLYGGPLRAAELGEVKVNSHIGQQLSADIELVDLTPADLAELQARLANPDVFKGANLSIPPVLGGLHISVAKRDNRRFLHLTTLQPVSAEALHLFLELSSGGRQIIRAASLWLTPEPPAQRVARASVVPAAMPYSPSQPAAPVPATAPQAPAAAPQAPPENLEAALSEAAQRAFAHRRQVAMAQAQAGAPAASTASVPAPEASKRPQAPAQPMARKTQPKPAAVPAPAPAASEVAAAKPVAGAAAACAPVQQVEAQIQQCQAMTSKLADIEGKVKRLQNALAAPGAAAPPPTAAKADGAPPASRIAPAASQAAPAKPGAAPIKPGVAADLAGRSKSKLIIIAGATIGALAIIGGLFYFLRKRRGKGPLQIWQSFRKKGNAEARDPVLEEPAVAAEG
jgi:pilus assembly protein FimV